MYRHALDFHRVVTAAIMCYLLLDVKRTRPALLFSDPTLYAARLRHGGGIVLWMYLLHAGFPVLTSIPVLSYLCLMCKHRRSPSSRTEWRRAAWRRTRQHAYSNQHTYPATTSPCLLYVFKTRTHPHRR